MSFILDALRKSENARQRHGGPALAEVPIRKRREARPWWIGAVAILLVVNLAVLIIVLTRNEPAPAAAQSAAVAPPPVPPASPATGTAPSASASAAATTPPPAPRPAMPPAGNARSLAEEAAGAVDLYRDPDAPEAGATAAARVPDRAPIVQPLAPPATTAAPAAASGSDEDLPTINELTGDRAANMPAMHIDIHVHSGRPQERFVFINMKKYVEGDTLSEGPILERITPDGVILNQRGFRFILPRQ